MRRPPSTPVFEQAGEVAVWVGVTGSVVLPAAPEDACPGRAEDAVRVLAAAVGGGLVDVVGTGVPVASGVGEYADVAAQARVAARPKAAWQRSPDSLATAAWP